MEMAMPGNDLLCSRPVSPRRHEAGSMYSSTCSGMGLPGATNSSGMIRIFGKAIEIVLKIMQEYETLVGQFNNHGRKYKAPERQL